MRWGKNVARMEGIRNPRNILAGKSKDKRPLGRPRRRWETSMKADLKEIGCEGVA